MWKHRIDTLLHLTDPSLVGLCLDTGHYLFGGGDPLEFLRKNANRIWHVHFKDCLPELAARSRREGWDYFTSVRNGIFCELGKGEIEFQAVKIELEKQGYAGWIVVEQDVLPGMGSPKDSAAATGNTGKHWFVTYYSQRNCNDNRAIMMNKVLRFGVIGAGRIGKIHAENLATRIPGIEVATIADINLTAAQEVATKLHIPAALSDYHAILSDPAIDAVAICSSTDTHARIVVEAAQQLHIFCEKPIDAVSLN
jgi:hypothetical protein